jgi:hypothetical protein
MNNTILGYVQAPNYTADKQVVKVQKQYVPYEYKTKGLLKINPDGTICEKDNEWESDKRNHSWE